ncbi:unnamed protein product [Debaryomyces tyrocola]|nr:unnamed protein product [Debaryomyces tyrocola]
MLEVLKRRQRATSIGVRLCERRYLSLLVSRTTNRTTIKTSSIITKRTVKTPTIDWSPLTSSKTNLAAAEKQAGTPILRRFFLGLMIAMPVISFFLGCWQVKRLKWKVGLISKSENSLAQPPLEEIPPNLDPAIIDEFEYRRFKTKGHFDYSQEMFLGPRIKNGMTGYLVVCPFVRSNGGAPILIERGWIHKDKVIPENRKGGYLSHLAYPQGEIEIEALFRVMPKKSNLQFDHDMGSRLFYVPDVEVMAEQSHSLPVYCQMIYSLKDNVEWRKAEEKQVSTSSWKKWLGFSKTTNEADNSDVLYISSKADEDSTLEYQEFEFIDQGVPIAAYPKVKFSNNHMQYLVTWFSLSFVSAGLLIYNFVKKRKYLSAEKVIEAKRRDMKNKW